MDGCAVRSLYMRAFLYFQTREDLPGGLEDPIQLMHTFHQRSVERKALVDHWYHCEVLSVQSAWKKACLDSSRNPICRDYLNVSNATRILIPRLLISSKHVRYGPEDIALMVAGVDRWTLTIS